MNIKIEDEDLYGLLEIDITASKADVSICSYHSLKTMHLSYVLNCYCNILLFAL